MLRTMLRALVPLPVLAALVCASPALASPEKVGPSGSIDALGDSITRGYDSQGSGCGALADCPAYSWATGTAAAVNSYYLRLKAINPAVLLAQPVKTSTTGGNDAVTGAKIGDLNGQAKNAVAAPNTPDQVLILMGANDVCTSTEASMTSVASFGSSYKAGLETLSKGLPDARIDVSSIPNIFQLWNVLHTNTAAQLTWGVAKICQSMLAKPTSEAAADKERRAKVQKRNEEFNAVLAEVCAEFIHCAYDKGAAFAIKFATSDVSTLDYFHPNQSGQAKAAANAWESGPNFSDLTTPTTSFTPSVAPNEAGWNNTNVQVSLSATENGFAVAGTEYKVGEASSWTRYTAPITISAEGNTTITARSVDVNGNIEASKTVTVKIDKLAPTFALTCPGGAITLGEPGFATVSEANDALSGFTSDPNGELPLNTTTPGNGQTESVTLSDVAGNQTTHACNYDVHYPDPGAPVQSGGANPSSSGLMTLGWTGSDPSSFGITYTLEHRNAAQAEFSEVASGISALAFSFTGEGESEGTWEYRVQGTDAGAGLTTAWSPSSSPIVVDKTAPNPVTATGDRAPDYAGGGGWFKDSVEVSFTANGDPALSDGSAGSGVNAGTLSSPILFNTSGSHDASGTVEDNAGNTSVPATLTMQVDATAPTVEVGCPAKLLVGESAEATIAASDGESGLAVDPSGTAPINTGKPGPQTTSATAVDNVGHETSSTCTTDVELETLGAPFISAGSNPGNDGVFTLSWTGTDPLTDIGLTYTLQHHNAASEEWTTLATGISALEYAFTGGGEPEGTWRYRVQGYDSGSEEATAFSPTSVPVVVDESAPSAPSASADRAPEYAGKGGWFKDSVEVSFSSNGDPQLSDGSPGTGVNPSTLSGPVVFNTSGSHLASSTVADNVGNVSAPGNLTVQVDATAPNAEVSCPVKVPIGGSASATVTASDGESGLAKDPSGTVTINTSKAGAQTVTRTAIDNVGHETSSSCTTIVGYTQVLTANIKGKLVVKAGQAIELTSTAKASGGIAVKPGGALDVEGAKVSGTLSSKGATVLRICGATLSGAVKASGGTGSVVLGEGNAECSANTFNGGVTLTGNGAGVGVDGNTFSSALKVTNNASGVTVINNGVAGNLTVTGNTGTVIDKPNEVEGKSKLQ